MSTPPEQRFIDAWRFAAPRLEQIRREELRQLDEDAGLRMIGAGEPTEHARSGHATNHTNLHELHPPPTNIFLPPSSYLDHSDFTLAARKQFAR